MKPLKKIVHCLFCEVSSIYQSMVELVFRVGISVFMLSHGWGKLSSFAEKSERFPDPLGVGSFLSLSLVVFSEFFCAILLIVGLFTRFASLSILITMLVAGFVIHGSDPFDEKELALLYAIGFLYFTVVGGNKYSVDQCIRKYLKLK